MAQKPNGKADRTDRIVFTRSSAERIAKVVRTVEAGPRAGSALAMKARPSFKTLYEREQLTEWA